VRGVALEFLRELGLAKPDAKRIDDLPADLITKYWGSVRIPNTDEFKLLMDGLIRRHSEYLSVLYHSLVCDVETKGGLITAVIVANKDGLVRIETRQVIDATGDADVAHWAGCPSEKNPEMMPLTMHFRIGNVTPNKEMGPAAKQALIDAHKAGKLPEFYGPGLIFAFAKDEAYIHATRIAGDATDAADLTRCEMQGRQDAWTIFREWKEKVPAFKDSYLISTGPYVGIRDTRRILGVERLTVEDLQTTRRHDDAIATGCWFLDIHPRKTTTDKPFAGSGFQPKPYDISYRTLIPQKVGNLLVAGRCHSATHVASASSRVTVTAMALGEAAGVAAALACETKAEVATVDGRKVREILSRRDAGPFTDA
ncbi:MAG: hypothetical protein RI910_1564, partial [Verrucomicrobiota bacterium]